MPDHDMRDIRADLQERTKSLEQQIEAAQAQFDMIFARLKQEHDIKVDDLKKELDAVLVVLGFEDQRFADTASSAQDVGAVVEGRALRRA
jgi:NADPH-dependent glutamate synthase beta subunit-like oxidoreductase